MVRSFFGRSGSSGIAAISIVLLLALGCNMRSDEEWTRVLGNRMLTKASTSGAISDRVMLYFCPNGEYARVVETTGFSGGGTGTLSLAGESVELGRWQVNGGTLTLRSQDGEQREFSLFSGTDENVVQLNGDNFLLGTHDECKPGS